MLGSVTLQNICQPEAPSTSAASSSSRPCACISGISSRATNGKVTKIVASTMPGTAKMILMSCSLEPGPEPALRAEHQHVDQARDHRRDRERQVDQRDQQLLAAEIELGDRPGGRDAEHEVQRHGDGRGQQRQPDGRQRIGLDERREVDAPSPLRNASTNTATSGSSRKSSEEAERQRRARATLTQRRIARRGVGLEARRAGCAAAACAACHGHQRTFAERRSVQLCSPLMMSSRTNETTSITAATAVAPA